MKTKFFLIYCVLFAITIQLTSSELYAQKYLNSKGQVRVAIVNNPYNGDRRGPEKDVGNIGGVYMTNGGIRDLLPKWGAKLENVSYVELTPDEEKEYGERNRLGMSLKHLADFGTQNELDGILNIGFYNNCSSLSGMLSALQHSGKTRRPLRIGLIWIDAHGDFNTPETSLSGMLGGMPVAVAVGHCLTNLRLQSGLQPALAESYVAMAGVRDTDPLEQERIDRYGIAQITVKDLKTLSANLHKQMERLSKLTEKIYIHVDMDVLDPPEVMGHPLTVPDGPTSAELAMAIEVMFGYEKTAGLGIASIPNTDEGKLSLKAAYNLIEGAVRGVKNRK